MALIPVDLPSLPGLIGLPSDATVSVTGSTDMLVLSDSSLAGFSTEISPAYLVLSSGIAGNITQPNTAGNQGTDIGTSGVADDTVTVSFSFTVPEGFTSFSFSFSFFSEEFPEFVGSQFNDFFSVTVNGTEVAIDTNGNPISVNNDFFSDTLTPVGTFFDGQTPPLQITTEVEAGSQVELVMSIGDVGDGIYDSAAFIGDFTLSTPQIVFLQFDAGSVNIPYVIEDEEGNLVYSFSIDLPGSGLSAAERQQVLDAVNAIYEDFNIEFVGEEPESGDFSTVHVGGSVSDLPADLGAPANLFGLASQIDYGNTDLNDDAFVLSGEIGTDPGDIAQLVQVIAHEAGHLLGLRHVDDEDALMYPFADPDATGIDDEDQPLAEIVDGVVTPLDPGGTQNSFEELVRNVGLDGAAPLIESESFFDAFLNFFNFSVAPEVTIYNAVAVLFVPDEDGGNLILSTVPLGNITDSGAGFVLPTLGGDHVAIFGESVPGGGYDSVLSDGTVTNVDFEALGFQGMLSLLGIDLGLIGDGSGDSNGANLTFGTVDEDGDITPVSDVTATVTDATELEATDGADNLTGTSLDDNILGLGGNDDIFGLAGNDTLLGNDGIDEITAGIGADVADGGSGDDSILGNNGFDTLNGGADNDTINGNAGADEISGGSGDDFLIGGINFDLIMGDSGNDSLFGQEGQDTLDGGTGDDDLNGNFGSDTLLGGAGEDTANGGVGFDFIDGGDGNDDLNGNNGGDTVLGGDGNDVIRGNAGSDRLDGQNGNDILVGGIGADTFIISPGNDVILDFQNDIDTIEISTVFFDGIPTDQEIIDAFDVVNGNLVAVLDAENSIRINNITDASLLLDDIIFVGDEIPL
ncbi:choice-of-anchor L domain-containing protein [Tateyamaria omphalii]|uniref:choice-of-anchor L domain-containing protein n=1 Tax=Tateyamaria omphalii TaxID=299262 RepID=UPI001C9976BD|nr:choice-of-anchor L domain-containing protein [Tateyamaria omphalii]MBY5935524.1 choice-of-anchor L domain-containing protein [Tateyamaria omphalii]